LAYQGILYADRPLDKLTSTAMSIYLVDLVKNLALMQLINENGAIISIDLYPIDSKKLLRGYFYDHVR